MSPLDTIAFPVGHFPSGAFPDGHFPKLPSGTYTKYLLYSPAYILSRQLITDSQVDEAYISYDWPVYVSHLPDIDGNSACLYDTAPIVEKDLVLGLSDTKYGINISIRSLDYEEGRTKAQELVDFLETLSNTTVEIGDCEYYIDTITNLSSYWYLGIDEKRKHFFSINLMMILFLFEDA